jgi:hypothetical protein
MNDSFLAFLDLGYLENGAACRGGCLITDIETNPQEFRCTASIRPTELQRVLYGKKLNEYVCKDLVGLPILDKVKIKPTLVIVQLPEFLSIRPNVEIPIVLIEQVQDRFRLLTHSNYREEIQYATDLLKKIDDITEPFMRVQNALQEAHRLKVGESK